MRNNNRKGPKPTSCYDESVIDDETGNTVIVRYRNTWAGVSTLFYLRDVEGKAMSQMFRFRMPDIDVRIDDIMMCVDTGRAMSQRFRRDRGFKIDVDLKRVADGISILLHVVTLHTDEGFPRHEMRAVDEGGKFRMTEDGKHIMVPATLTFERFFPESKLQKLYEASEDLLAAMMLRRIRRTLRARGDRKMFGELQRSLEFFLETSEENKPERLTAKVGEVSAKSGQRPGKKGDGRQKAKIKPAKIGAASTEATPVDRTDDLARKLTVSLGFEDPGTGLPTDAEGNTPEPVASASPTPAPSPPKATKKEKAPRPPKLGLADVGSLANQVLPGPTNGTNDQK